MKAFIPAVTLASLGYAFVVLPELNEASTIENRADDTCSNITCVPSSGAAHIIVSRASTEAAGTGILGVVADAIIDACPGSDVAANPYPALLSPYVDSEAQGLGNLTEVSFNLLLLLRYRTIFGFEHLAPGRCSRPDGALREEGSSTIM